MNNSSPRTFAMLQSKEARQVAEGTNQMFTALACCLALQGIDMALLGADLDRYRTMRLHTDPLGAVADQMLQNVAHAMKNGAPDSPSESDLPPASRRG